MVARNHTMKSESENLMGADTGKTITRRSAIRIASQTASFAGLTLNAGLASAQSIYTKRSATAFALAGDRYHNIDYIRTALRKTLVKDLGISLDFTDELSLLTASNLKPYKLGSEQESDGSRNLSRFLEDEFGSGGGHALGL